MAAFWAHRRAGVFDRQAVVELCALAGDDDPGLAQEAAQTLFGELVEPLSDAFEADHAATYVDVFAEIIQAACSQPGAERLERELAAFGLQSAAALAERGRHLLTLDRPAPVGAAQRFLVLSRITLGADVAIVTPILDGLLRRDPAATALLIAPEASRGLVGGHPRIDFLPLRYPRRGSLVERLAAWQGLLDLVRTAIKDGPSDWLVLDPDSRLTQLGLLPLVSDATLRYFPSRTIERPGRQRLGELAAAWVQELSGSGESAGPRIWLTPEARRSATAQRATALGPDGGTTVVVSFGVGGNERKRVGQRFEVRVLEMLAEAELTVLLARGVTPEEHAETSKLIRELQARGTSVDTAPETEGHGRGRVVTWQADTAGFCAIVEAGDAYLGYDSAGQHVAAAVGTPGVTVFVRSAGERHLERWSPWGAGASRVIAVDPDQVDPEGLAHEAARAVLEAARLPRPTAAA